MVKINSLIGVLVNGEKAKDLYERKLDIFFICFLGYGTLSVILGAIVVNIINYIGMPLSYFENQQLFLLFSGLAYLLMPWWVIYDQQQNQRKRR